MRIIVSAYACNPYGGSEPGVGWTAVNRIAKRHEVCVLTDIHNKPGWDKGYAEGLIPENIRVRFIRKRASSIANPFIAHISSWLSYAEYNRAVLAEALAWHEQEHFDLCHQVTIASWRMPSPLWKLPIPFVWGPIGGAGFIPHEFRRMLSFKSRIFESLRDLNTFISKSSKSFHDCIQNTSMIICANMETEEFLIPFRNGKPMVRLPVTSMSERTIQKFKRPVKQRTATEPLRLFAGGNMEGRKGTSLALRALARVAAKGIDFHYTIGGGGPEIDSLRSLAVNLGIDRNVSFHQGFSGEDYLQELWRSDVYFLPSFRETMGITLVEAILAGCYPVVADTSAQGEIVRMKGGTAVPVVNMESLIQGLADAILWCQLNRHDLAEITAPYAARLTEYIDERCRDRAIEQIYLNLAGNVPQAFTCLQ